MILLDPAKPVSKCVQCFLTLLASLFITGCHRGQPRQSAPDALALLPQYWLLNAPLSTVPGGPAVRTVRGPVRVELSTDGRVRTLSGSQEPLEGYLLEAQLTQPADRAGLMLYAQRTAELHLDMPDGPIIGRLHPGAFVGVAARGGRSVVVAVPRYRRTNSKAGALLAYVEVSALGVAPIAERAPAIAGKLVRNFGVPLHLREQWAAIDNLLCGGFHIEESNGDTRATQYYRGIEVSGWLESAWYWGDHGPSPCPARTVYRGNGKLVLLEGRDWLDAQDIASIPPGFTAIDPPLSDPLAKAIEQGQSLYWLTLAHGQLACRGWHPKAHWLHAGQSGANVFANRDQLEGELSDGDEYFPMNYTPVSADKSGGWLELLGPHFKKSHTGWRCGVAFTLRAAQGATLYMEGPGAYSSGGGPPKEYAPVAFHPEDVERWYLSRDGCNTALANAAREIEKDPTATERLGLHFQCNEEPP